MSEFEFVDPSVVQNNRRTDPQLFKFADALRQRPGDWAKHPTQEQLSTKTLYNRASRINNDYRQPNMAPPAALRGGEFEAAVSKGVLYVRYTGKKAS